MVTSTGISTSTIISSKDANIYYGNLLAKNSITAFIGPSGCGKSTVLRCFNRLNDLITSFKMRGSIQYHGQDLYSPEIDPVAVRRQIGMVFQKPNPFPKSIYDNIAFGPRLVKYKGNMDELVERSLRGSALWDEVKDKLGGQQQRLCIARAIAMQPDVILMDEPCAALDPISTLKVEDLLQELKEKYTIVIVTHNMQQASRASDYTAFFNVEQTERGRTGYIAECDRTEVIFQNPQQQATQAYVSGRFG
jgi:phosphate transport system ATP-binding protein